MLLSLCTQTPIKCLPCDKHSEALARALFPFKLHNSPGMLVLSWIDWRTQSWERWSSYNEQSWNSNVGPSIQGPFQSSAFLSYTSCYVPCQVLITINSNSEHIRRNIFVEYTLKYRIWFSLIFKLGPWIFKWKEDSESSYSHQQVNADVRPKLSKGRCLDPGDGHFWE